MDRSSHVRHASHQRVSLLGYFTTHPWTPNLVDLYQPKERFQDIGRNQETTAVPASASRGNIQEKAANLYAEHTEHTWKHTR
jgi:hypothetical protein